MTISQAWFLSAKFVWQNLEVYGCYPHILFGGHVLTTVSIRWIFLL